jgi:hypothetical protein
LRYLQTMADMSHNGKSSTIVFPLPLDLIRPLMEAFPAVMRPKDDDKPITW